MKKCALNLEMPTLGILTELMVFINVYMYMLCTKYVFFKLMVATIMHQFGYSLHPIIRGGTTGAVQLRQLAFD